MHTCCNRHLLIICIKSDQNDYIMMQKLININNQELKIKIVVYALKEDSADIYLVICYR